MPLLQVRNCPAELLEAISRSAHSENRSIPQQTIVLLKTALEITSERRVRRKVVFEEIDNLGIIDAENFPDPVRLIREDRDR